ncbi:MAG: leucine-rich repeat protein [Bacteroidales bacterium]|nr:leucine-rich repeat protein [Bacteroidales bacterium]
MKANYHIKTGLFVLAAMVACTQLEKTEESQNSANDGFLQELSVTGKDFNLDIDTRSSVTIGENGASFVWNEDDVIGIFPDKGDQVSFAMEEGAGTQTATFSGGGWALKSSAKYAAYYPHVYENRDLTAIPVSYLGQTQNGNANADHIGEYDFMAAAVSTPSNGAVAFDMHHLGALVQLSVTVAEPSKLIHVTFHSDADFIEYGTIDLSANTPVINAKELSKSFRISLSNLTTTEPNEEVLIYFMMAPVDLTDKSLKAIIEKDNHYFQEIELTGKKFEAGKAYRLAANMVSEEESPAIISDVTAGNLESLIMAEYPEPYKLSALKVIGNLNGTDIRFLRKMAGRKEDGTETSGKLTYLDLTDANIVSGGNYYYKPKSGTEYTTENNVAGDYMFYFCNLETIKLPSTVTKLGQQVCSHLPNSIGNENIEGTDHIGTFTSIIIPEGVTAIGDMAFAWNQNLASIELPNTVTKTGEASFYRCDALTSIYIPDSVEQCPSFTACFGLKYIRLSENSKFTYIGSAFRGCRSLTSLTIPSNIQTISSYAFGNENDPSALKELHFISATPPSLHENSYLPKNCKIYVPKGSYNSYKSKSPYNNYTIVEE